MKNSLSKKNIYLKNISEYLVLWAVGGCIYYGIEVLFRGFSHISMFMSWRTVHAVFYMAGAADKLAGHSAKTDYTLYDLRCEYGIYHWNYRKQMVSPGSLGLFGYAIAVMGADLPSFALVFSFLCTMGILLSGYLLHWFYKEPMPHYRIW